MLQNRLTLIHFFLITVKQSQKITGRISDSENKSIEGAYLINKKLKIVNRALKLF